MSIINRNFNIFANNYFILDSTDNDSMRAAGQNTDALRKRGGSKQDSMKLAKTLFTIFIVFAVCWAPHSILIVVDYKDRANQFWHVLFIMFAHTNSSLNCVVYALTNKHFRQR